MGFTECKISQTSRVNRIAMTTSNTASGKLTHFEVVLATGRVWTKH